MTTHPPIERLAWLAARLRQGDRVNTKTMAAHFEIDRRTVRRDVEFLRDRMRYEVEWDNPQLSYRLTSAPEPVL